MWSAACRRRRPPAALRSSRDRTRLAALVAYALAISPPSSPPTLAVRRTRPAGIELWESAPVLIGPVADGPVAPRRALPRANELWGSAPVLIGLFDYAPVAARSVFLAIERRDIVVEGALPLAA